VFHDPTPTELAATEAEWPLIAAELAVVEAECRLAVSVDVLAVRAHRRAVARLTRIAREYVVSQSGATRRKPLVPDHSHPFAV
jgi:hypothetical protein